MILAGGGDRLHGLVLPPHPCLRDRALGENHRRVFGSIPMV